MDHPKKAAARKTSPGSGLMDSVRLRLLTLSLPMLMSSLATSIVNVGLPTFTKTFAASFQQVQWIILVYLLAVTMMIVTVGWLGDLTGRRRLLIAGIFLFTAASVLCGLAPSLWFLIAARALQGLGAATMMALTLALVAELVPREKVGRAMGLLGTMSAVGTALGPALGGALIGSLGWPAIFLINIPFGAVTLVLAYRVLPVDRQSLNQSRVSFDVSGTFLLIVTLAAYALAMTIGRGSLGPLNFVLLAAAVFGVALFIVAENRATSPLIRLARFRDPVLSAGFIMSILVTTVVMATLVIGPFYLSSALALKPASVGFVMSAGPIVAALVGIPGGRAVDAFGARRITIVGLVAMAFGSLLLPELSARLGVRGYAGALIILTAGYALFQAANNTAVMMTASLDQRGVVSGLLNLARNLGLITGASVMGAIFAYASGTPNIMTANPDAVAAGMRMTFGFAAALMLVALLLAFLSQVISRPAQLSEAG